MARVFSMNADRDIHAVGGRLQIATGLEAVLQNCERSILANFGEMIYATQRGVNYFRDVFGSSPDVIRFEAGARAQLLRVNGVTGIQSFSVQVQNNQLTYAATIQTQFGTETISNTIGARNGNV